MKLVTQTLPALLTALLTVSCDSGAPIAQERYVPSDLLAETVQKNVASQPGWQIRTQIDHSRLGAEEGSFMPPARVLLFSDPKLESALLQAQPLLGLDLPLKVLAFESPQDGSSYAITNEYPYLAKRYGLPDSGSLRDDYGRALDLALQGIPADQVAHFESDELEDGGFITLPSSFSFEESLQRVRDAIASQDDTVGFGEIDFAAEALALGVQIEPATLILFGAPGPGASAMANAPTLGLDGFCQKFLVWQDDAGRVQLSFNDLLALARRQGVDIPLPLRVINYRLKSVFEEALEP